MALAFLISFSSEMFVCALAKRKVAWRRSKMGNFIRVCYLLFGTDVAIALWNFGFKNWNLKIFGV
jgi:hypothetical protein